MRIVVPIIAAIVAISFAGSASAQCSMPGMSGGHDHSGSTKANSQENSKMTGMMKDISGLSQEMTKDFADLHQHFGQMMQIDDMDKLKEEMQEHNDMMVGLHKKMSDQREKCREMMSMTGQESKSSSDDGHTQHNH